MRPALLGWLAAAAVAVAVVATGGWLTANYRDFDFFPMWLAGREIVRGTDIYDPVAWRALFVREHSQGYALLPGTGYGYPLPAALLMIPFGLLPLQVAAAVWAVAVVALTASGAWALVRALFGHHARRDLVVLGGLTAAHQALWVVLFTGQPSGILIGIVAHASALLFRGRSLGSGSLLGILILKPHLFLWSIPVLLGAAGDRARLVTGAIMTGGTLVAASFAIRTDWPVAWLSSAGRLQGMNVSRANAWGIAPDNVRWLGWIVLAVAVAAFVMWWRSRPPLPALWSGALALSLLGSPYSWSYDTGILIVPAAVVIGGVADRAPSTRIPVLLALALAFGVLPWLLYLDAHRTGAETAAAVVPMLVLTLVIATDRIRRRAEVAC